jgi:putative NIF3 family GTP cyclohydrolase 1 type 2
VLDRIELDRDSALALLPFGPEVNNTVAIVSGGAPMVVNQAVDAGTDLYITGDASHSIYHTSREAGINVISAGHYATETWGVSLLAERVAADLGLKTFLVDIPTGL